MKEFFKKHYLKFIGLIVGAIGGYLYYHYVGCVSGTCPITSNPWRMTLYGAVLGLLLFDIFKKETPKKTDKKVIDNNNSQ